MHFLHFWIDLRIDNIFDIVLPVIWRAAALAPVHTKQLIAVTILKIRDLIFIKFAT